MRDHSYDDLICFAFYRGWRLIQEVYEDVLEGEATPQRLYVMGACRAEPRHVGDLARLLRIDSSAISNLVRRLERDGHVSRRRADGDGRGVQVSLTDAGRAFLAERDERIDEIDVRLASDIPKAERAALLGVVRRLAAMTGDAGQAPTPGAGTMTSVQA